MKTKVVQKKKRETAERAPNPWLIHVQAYSKKHPHKKWSDCLKEAKKTYKKQEDTKARLSLGGKKKTSGKRYRSSGTNENPRTCLEDIDDSFLNQKGLKDIDLLYQKVDSTRTTILKHLKNEQKIQKDEEEEKLKQQNEEVKTEKNAVLEQAGREREKRYKTYQENDEGKMKQAFTDFLIAFLENFDSYFSEKNQNHEKIEQEEQKRGHNPMMRPQRIKYVDMFTVEKFKQILNDAITGVNGTKSIQNTAYMLFRDILALRTLTVISTPPSNLLLFKLSGFEYEYSRSNNYVQLPDVALEVGTYNYSITLLLNEIDAVMKNKSFDYDGDDDGGDFIEKSGGLPYPLHAKYSVNNTTQQGYDTNHNLVLNIIEHIPELEDLFTDLVNKLNRAKMDFDMQKKLKTNKKGRAYEYCSTILPNTLLTGKYTRTIIEKVEKVANFNLTRSPRTLVLFENQIDAYLAWFDPSVNIEPTPNELTETKIGNYCKGVIKVTTENLQKIKGGILSRKAVTFTENVNNKIESFKFDFSKAISK